MPHRLSVSDLTIRDIKSLVKDFFTASLTLGVVFGLPYALFLGMDVGLQSSLPVEAYSWFSGFLGFGFLAFFAYILLKNLAKVLQNFGKLLVDLRQAPGRVSLPKQILWVAVFIGFVFIWVRYPGASFLLFCLVILPAGFTYDKYKGRLKRKSERNLRRNER